MRRYLIDHARRRSVGTGEFPTVRSDEEVAETPGVMLATMQPMLSDANQGLFQQTDSLSAEQRAG
jgi:hypothetical protein